MGAFSKETYVTRNFQKISGKRWELYVITRVIHSLNDPDIEYVCQQYINPPKNNEYYLADLHFIFRPLGKYEGHMMIKIIR